MFLFVNKEIANPKDEEKLIPYYKPTFITKSTKIGFLYSMFLLNDVSRTMHSLASRQRT